MDKVHRGEDGAKADSDGGRDKDGMNSNWNLPVLDSG